MYGDNCHGKEGLTAKPNRLLLVAGDAGNLDTLSSRLSRSGYSVEVAENGPSALEKICRAQYDLVLLDQLTPGMSGLDLLRLLRATYSQSDLPVIMVTPGGQSQTVAEALDQGANDFVVKPVDVPAITARIEAQLSRRTSFEPGLRARAQERISTAIDLRGAVERGELLAVYQPKIRLSTQTIVGFEALLRWRHPERGLLHPADFIPMAEETGLILPLGEWILAAACRQLKSWQTNFSAVPPLSMNVNLSVKQLRDRNLVDCVRNILAETGITPGTLKLELTESCLITEIESAKEVLADLKALPVCLELDDFGTGYSSLSYLRSMPFDSLKIDHSFVKRMSSDSESAAIVETIVKLAHALHMNVVAEGIEDESQLARLVSLGCETGQGYYFSAPLEADAAEKLLAGKSAEVAQR